MNLAIFKTFGIRHKPRTEHLTQNECWLRASDDQYFFVIYILFLECECNIKGSLPSICDTTKGNCYCKPHVVGQNCSICESGYFEFPNCKGKMGQVKYSIALNSGSEIIGLYILF